MTSRSIELEVVTLRNAFSAPALLDGFLVELTGLAIEG